MAALTYYASDNMHNLTLGGTVFASPGPVYLSLMTVAGTASGSGTEVPGITRQAITFAAPSAGAVASNADVTFAPVDVDDDRTVVGWTIWDASTAGNMLAFHTFAGSEFVEAGNDETFLSGSVTITSNGLTMSDYLAGKWLNHLFRATSYTPPTDCYLAHYTATPTRSTAGTELSDSAYNPQIMTFAGASSGLAANDGTVSWEPLLADADAALPGWALKDAAGGNVLWFKAWSSPIAATIGDRLILAPNTIDLTAL